MHTLWRDTVFAVRMLPTAPGFALGVIVTLALAIGANTAAFSVVNGLLLRSLPVSEAHRLVTVSSGASASQAWSYAIWQAILDRSQRSDGVCAWYMERFRVGQDPASPRVDGMFVSGDFFSTLGVPPLLGRTFTIADDVRGGGDGPVAIISYGFWQQQFGGAREALGSRVIVETVPFTVVGIMPASFFGPEVGRRFDVAVPIGSEPLLHGKSSALDARMALWLRIVLRLKRGESIEAATAALRSTQSEIREASMPTELPQFQQAFLKEPFTLIPVTTGISPLRERYRTPVVTILVLVSLVLLLACANLVNLTLARAQARRKEVSIRLALGASRARVIRQLLIESFVLAGLGALFGMLLATWGSRALVAQLSTTVNRVFLDTSLDWRVMGFTATITVLATLLFGTVPAFRVTHAGMADALRPRGGTSLRGSRTLFSSRLVILQVMVSIVLVLVAGLFIRTFERLARKPLGFEQERVLVVSVDTGATAVTPAARGEFYQRVVDSARQVPGVAAAAASMFTPLTGGSNTVLVDVPSTAHVPEMQRTSVMNVVTSRWLATYGMTIHEGRDIESRDTTSTQPVMLVNRMFAKTFFPGGRVLGENVVLTAGPKGALRIGSKTIVGIVDDAVYGSPRDSVRPTLYMPLAQWDLPIPLPPYIDVSIRSSNAAPETLTRSVIAAFSNIDQRLILVVRTLADQVDAMLIQERLVARLSGLFGVLALLMAGVGIYGVTASDVAHRRTEIGIRMALGAQQSDIVRLAMTRSVVGSGIGISLGLACGAALTRYVKGMLFGVTALDSVTFLGVSLLFVSVTILAVVVPAFRATRVDPLVTLRAE